MYTATFSTENGVFEPALPEVLFDLGASSQIASRFRLSPAGERFIVLAPADKESQSDPANPRVMVNWFEELKSKTPENKNE